MNGLKKCLIALFSLATALNCFAISENNYKESFLNSVLPYYKTNSQLKFLKSQLDGLELSYTKIPSPDAKKVLVISTGQSEAAIKYSELAYDLRDDFEVYIIEHRGQGNSMKTSAVESITHVRNFSNYVSDFSNFISEIKNNDERPMYLLAHSMGGMIATLYLTKEKNPPIKKVILTSPMHGIKFPVPNFLVKAITKVKLSKKNNCERFAIQQVPYLFNDYSFENEGNTTSESRSWMKKYLMNEEVPHLAIGGVSNCWLLSAMKSISSLKKSAQKINKPFKLFQASDDSLVDSKNQDLICNLVGSKCTKHVFLGAKHEIFHEKDQFRNQALKILREYFN